jgi:hypothetical protein
VNAHPLTRIVVLLLRLLLGFGVVSCAIGAVMGIFLGGAGVPMEYLDGSPFSSFVLPGIILGVVVGGTQAAGLWGMLRSPRAGLLLAAVAGFGMLIWIFVELAMISEYSFLQALYFGVGLLELIAVTALLGIAPRILPAWSGVPLRGTFGLRRTDARGAS